MMEQTDIDNKTSSMWPVQHWNSRRQSNSVSCYHFGLQCFPHANSVFTPSSVDGPANNHWLDVTNQLFNYLTNNRHTRSCDPCTWRLSHVTCQGQRQVAAIAVSLLFQCSRNFTFLSPSQWSDLSSLEVFTATRKLFCRMSLDNGLWVIFLVWSYFRFCPPARSWCWRVVPSHRNVLSGTSDTLFSIL